jgi:hypothetical protein
MAHPSGDLWTGFFDSQDIIDRVIKIDKVEGLEKSGQIKKVQFTFLLIGSSL